MELLLLEVQTRFISTQYTFQERPQVDPIQVPHYIARKQTSGISGTISSSTQGQTEEQQEVIMRHILGHL